MDHDHTGHVPKEHFVDFYRRMLIHNNDADFEVAVREILFSDGC